MCIHLFDPAQIDQFNFNSNENNDECLLCNKDFYLYNNVCLETCSDEDEFLYNMPAQRVCEYRYVGCD